MSYREARSILNRPKLTGSTGNLNRTHNLPICTGNLSRLAGFVASARRASLSNSGEMISRRAHQVISHKYFDYDNIICCLEQGSKFWQKIDCESEANANFLLKIIYCEDKQIKICFEG